jgi:hypothetical protein
LPHLLKAVPQEAMERCQDKQLTKIDDAVLCPATVAC